MFFAALVNPAGEMNVSHVFDRFLTVLMEVVSNRPSVQSQSRHQFAAFTKSLTLETRTALDRPSSPESSFYRLAVPHMHVLRMATTILAPS